MVTKVLKIIVVCSLTSVSLTLCNLLKILIFYVDTKVLKELIPTKIVRENSGRTKNQKIFNQ